MSGTVQRADEVLEACRTWARHHHQTGLTGAEATHIRAKLKQRLHDLMRPAPTDVELVTMAHRLANEAIQRRRDTAALRVERNRMAGA